VVTPAKAKQWRPGCPLPPLSTRQLTLLALVGELQPVARPTLAARLGVHACTITTHIGVLRRLRLVASVPQRGPNARLYLWAHVPKVKPAMPRVQRQAKPAPAAPKTPGPRPAPMRPAASVWDYAQRVVPAISKKRKA
jgi:hypothetical protein